MKPFKIEDDAVFTNAGIPFFSTSVGVFSDPELSDRAKGLFGIISMIEKGTKHDIMSYSKSGRDGFQSGIKELIEAGYLVKSKQNGSDGKFGSVTYFPDWGTLPQPAKPLTENPVTVESIPITKNFKLHSSQSDDYDVPPEKNTRVGKAGSLPKTDPSLVQYLVMNDPSQFIDDITDEHDMLTLRRVFEKDDWQFKYASNFWQIGHRNNFLTVPQWMKKTLVIQKWADEFDKIIRTKKGTRDQVSIVMRWLFEVDDFWFKTGNLASPAKFHQAYKKDGCNYRFEFFLKKALQDVPSAPIARQKFTAARVEEILTWHKSLKMKDFKSMGNNMYMFIPEQEDSDEVS